MIFHIVKKPEWEAATRNGSYRPASVEAEGFIHCSTSAQLIDTANRFYAGWKDLVALCIEGNRIAAPLKLEAPERPHDHKLDRENRYRAKGGDLFPHIYGALNLDAVIRVVELPCGTDGQFEMPAELRDKQKHRGKKSDVIKALARWQLRQADSRQRSGTLRLRSLRLRVTKLVRSARRTKIHKLTG